MFMTMRPFRYLCLSSPSRFERLGISRSRGFVNGVNVSARCGFTKRLFASINQKALTFRSGPHMLSLVSQQGTNGFLHCLEVLKHGAEQVTGIEYAEIPLSYWDILVEYLPAALSLLQFLRNCHGLTPLSHIEQVINRDLIPRFPLSRILDKESTRNRVSLTVTEHDGYLKVIRI